MSTLSYPQLAAAGEPGGAIALSLVTELAPAGGPHAGIAPARYVVGRNTPTFAYQTRFIDGDPAATVIVDHRQGQLDRVEAAIVSAIRDEHPLLCRVPRVRVSYDDDRSGPGCYTDLELPQRIFDRHILAGTVDGTPVPAHPVYRAARDCSPADARALLELSPGSLVFGARDAGPACFPGALTGEIIGVLADQRDGAGTQPGPAEPDQAGRIEESAKGRGDKAGPTVIRDPGGEPSTSQPPVVVGCRRIIRTQVLSFTALRALRFDAGPAGDAACRALLAAYALAGLVRANAELAVGVDCDLVEAGPTAMKLDARNGAFVALDPPSIEQADELLERALEAARREADISWRGQIFEVTGDPAVDAGEAGEGGRQFWRMHLIEGRGLGSRS